MSDSYYEIMSLVCNGQALELPDDVQAIISHSHDGRPERFCVMSAQSRFTTRSGSVVSFDRHEVDGILDHGGVCLIAVGDRLH